MARKKFVSLDHELQTTGYLTLSKAVKWLKAYHPERSISYPTALRMIEDDRLLSVKVGGQHRVNKSELVRFVAHGNNSENNRNNSNGIHADNPEAEG